MMDATAIRGIRKSAFEDVDEGVMAMQQKRAGRAEPKTALGGAQHRKNVFHAEIRTWNGGRYNELR